MHALNVLEDVVGLGVRDDRRSLIERALCQLAKVESGVLVLIRESSPASVAARLRAAAEGQSADAAAGRLVDYGVGAQILLDLGVREMELLSNSPLPKIIGLEGYGLKIIGRRAIE
jgi:3,4-dihydroxy 2-butanone 4-phosphate synthase/GTP cyclohydrolase II